MPLHHHHDKIIIKILTLRIPVLLILFVLSAKGSSNNANNNYFNPNQQSIFPQLPIAIFHTDNHQCKQQSDLYRQSLDSFTLWAHEMWDSTAKASTGVLRGNVFQMGHFEQCLTATAPFPTQYCLATVTANIPKPVDIRRDPISLYYRPNESIFQKLYSYGDPSQQRRNVVQIGWCVPASCTAADIESTLNSHLNRANISLLVDFGNVTYNASVSPLVCQTEADTKRIDLADIAFCILTLVLIILVVTTTIYDEVRSKDYKHSEFIGDKQQSVRKIEAPTLLYRLAMTFSAKKNYHDLTRPDASQSPLKILYGMRTFCILLIILDHRFGTFTSSALLNFDYVEKQYRSPIACFLFHGDLFVDSFFLLSGLLVTYGLLNQFEKKMINPGFIVLLRYVRLTPVYAFVIFYYATLFGHSGSGPLWKIIAGEDSEDCKSNWWTNLLYISNYVNTDHMCMAHSWYLPCDFHYFIIGIGICLLIRKEKKVGLGALLLLTLASLIIPFALTIAYTRPALLYFYPEFLTGPKIHPDFQLTYIKSHTRATPYFIGMFTGYIYYQLKDTTSSSSSTKHHVCWIKSYTILFVSLCLVLVAIVGGAVFYNPYHGYNAVEAASYAALHRAAFAIGSAGILYVTSYGHVSILYRILSWQPLIPLSKLVYGAYLVHMQFQLRAAAKFMNPRLFSYFDVISLALSDMVLAFATALALYLGIEAPFRRIFKELLMPPTTTARVGPQTHKRDTMILANNGQHIDDSRL